MKKHILRLTVIALIAFAPFSTFAEPKELDKTKVAKVLTRCLSTSAAELRNLELFEESLESLEGESSETFVLLYNILNKFKGINNFKMLLVDSSSQRFEETANIVKFNRQIDAYRREIYSLLKKLGKTNCNEYLSENGPLAELYDLRAEIDEFLSTNVDQLKDCRKI